MYKNVIDCLFSDLPIWRWMFPFRANCLYARWCQSDRLVYHNSGYRLAHICYRVLRWCMFYIPVHPFTHLQPVLARKTISSQN